MIDYIQTLKDFAGKYITRPGVDDFLDWYVKQPNAEKVAQEAVKLFNEMYKRLWIYFVNDNETKIQEVIAFIGLFFNCGKLDPLLGGYGEDSIMVLKRFTKVTSKELTYFLHAEKEDETYNDDPIIVELHAAYIRVISGVAKEVN